MAGIADALECEAQFSDREAHQMPSRGHLIAERSMTSTFEGASQGRVEFWKKLGGVLAAQQTQLLEKIDEKMDQRMAPQKDALDQILQEVLKANAMRPSGRWSGHHHSRKDKSSKRSYLDAVSESGAAAEKVAADGRKHSGSSSAKSPQHPSHPGNPAAPDVFNEAAAKLQQRMQIQSARTLRLGENDERLKNAANRPSNQAKVRDNTLDLSHMNPVRRCIFRMVGHSIFEVMSFIVIISNVVLVGIEIDALAATNDPDIAKMYVNISYVYTTLFTLELAMRFVAEGINFFFHSDNLGWNWFDVFIVATSLTDMCMNLVHASGAADMSHLRALRAIRVTRLLRVFRVVRLVRFIRALRTLIYSILVTLRSLVWALMLLVLVCYSFGVAFTQAVSDHLFTVGGQAGECNDITDAFSLVHSVACAEQRMKNYWGSLPRAMFTLFKVLCGGVDWEEVARPLSDVSWVMVALFVGYLFLTIFAFLNVVTGIFCQSAIEGAQQDKDIAAMHMLANRAVYTETLKNLFLEIDADHSGSLSLDEFEQYLAYDKFRAYLESLSIETNDAWTLFKLLDSDETGTIDTEEFVDGCLLLKGYAKAIHIAKLAYDNNIVHMQIEQFMDDTEIQLGALIEWAGLTKQLIAPPNAAGRKRGSLRLGGDRGSMGERGSQCAATRPWEVARETSGTSS